VPSSAKARFLSGTPIEDFQWFPSVLRGIYRYVTQRNNLARTPSHRQRRLFHQYVCKQKHAFGWLLHLSGLKPHKDIKTKYTPKNSHCSLSNGFWYILVQIFNLESFEMWLISANSISKKRNSLCWSHSINPRGYFWFPSNSFPCRVCGAESLWSSHLFSPFLLVVFSSRAVLKTGFPFAAVCSCVTEKDERKKALRLASWNSYVITGTKHSTEKLS